MSVENRRTPVHPAGPQADRTTSVDRMLASARSRLTRLTPQEAFAEAAAGAVLVDTRNAGQRAVDGVIPGALIVERNHLEWRFDPEGDARLPQATGFDARIIVLCDEGYASSLAAVSLLDLGLTNATDVIGGFQAWRAAGLPVED